MVAILVVWFVGLLFSLLLCVVALFGLYDYWCFVIAIYAEFCLF